MRSLARRKTNGWIETESDWSLRCVQTDEQKQNYISFIYCEGSLFRRSRSAGSTCTRLSTHNLLVQNDKIGNECLIYDWNVGTKP